MTSGSVAADMVRGGSGMVAMHLREFTDQQMFARPVPAANHAMWQVGHLTGTAARMTVLMGGKDPVLPEGFATRFTKETATFDDPGAFPSRDELMRTFDATIAALADAIAAATPEQLAAEAPEGIRRMAPTVGHVAILASTHTAMHVGQFQVIRRSLGLPVMF